MQKPLINICFKGIVKNQGFKQNLLNCALPISGDYLPKFFQYKCVSAELLFTFFIGLIATFLGTIPFGPINLAVVNITLKKGFQDGFRFSIGASLVEIVEVALAIAFGAVVQNLLSENLAIQLIIIVVFIVVGLYYLFSIPRPVLKSRIKIKVSPFIKGVLVAFANPQSIPFWVFVLTFISQYIDLNFTGFGMTAFFIGVFGGKLLALLLFAYSSKFLRPKLELSCKIINKSLGVILILIGLSQIYKNFWPWS